MDDQQTPESASSSSKSRPPSLKRLRDETNETQNVTGEGNQRIIPPPNPPPQCLAYRVLIIPHEMEIVSVLSAFATHYGQAMYIGHGTGYVSQATFFSLSERSRTGHQRFQNGFAQIGYLSGWFHPMLPYNSPRLVPLRLANGVLHVGLRHERLLECVSLATALVSSGTVEVNVLFVCGPGSIIQPYLPGGPREMYTILAPP